MKISAIIVSVIFIILFEGCSLNHNPVTLSQLNINEASTVPVGVTDRFPDGSPAGGAGVLGLFDLRIDPSNPSAELVSIRQPALTDVLEVVDITNFLQIAPCTDCVKIKSVRLDSDSNVVLSIGIKHPFPVGNPYEPISGRNRADLHVFNVEGIVISNLPVINFPLTGEKIAEFGLVNADGYTGYLDDSLDTIYPNNATIHPYILHFDDYSQGNFNPANPMGFQSVTDPPPSGNLVMAMGCDYNYQDYTFKIDGPVDFIFAVGCTYGVSAAKKIDRFNPEYRVPQHNKKAASEVSVEIISNDLIDGDTASTADIEIHVVDLSHGVPKGTALNQMYADSSVKEIRVEIPGVMLTPLVINGTSSISGSGHSPADPLVYAATVTNTSSASKGQYTGLVKVADSYSPGQNQSALLEGKDGISRVDPDENPLSGLFNISQFETYQVFSIDVAEYVPIDTIYVDNSYTGSPNDGTTAHPFKTIQDGIDAALDGYTVKVDDSGTSYNEQVSMKSNITVIAENWDTSDGVGRVYIDGPLAPETCSVLFTNVSNATLKGFKVGFAGLWTVGWPFTACTLMLRIEGGSNIMVQDCLFTGLTDLDTVCPIAVYSATDVTIANCRIDGIDRDSAESGCTIFRGIFADSCPGINIRNCVFANIRKTLDVIIFSKQFEICYISSSAGAVVKNNIIHHIVPHSPGDVNFLEGFHFENCTNTEIVNNTIDTVDSGDAIFINQCYAYIFNGGSVSKFDNNIATHIYSSGFPPPLARGVTGSSCTVICDFTDVFDIGPGINGANYSGSASAGMGAISATPSYIDPNNEQYDLSSTSAAQQGDPNFVDWDDTGTPSGNPGNTDKNTRSRMGCHGGPDGEIVGLLT